MVALQARRLAQHYALLLTVIAVPLLVLILALASGHLERQRQMLLDGLAIAVEAESRSLAPLAQAGDGGPVAERLRGGDWRAGAAWIVDRRSGTVLAGSSGKPLPAELGSLPAGELARPGPGFRPLGDQLVLARPLGSAPFTLLYAIPEGEARRLILGHCIPYGLILLGLLATVLTAQLVLQRRFIRPALALVGYIDALSRGQPDARPHVPHLWQPWLDAVGEAFARSGQLRARLAASEARLKAAAESIPEGLAIFDADDRLAFHNSRYPEHLTANARATMALGRSRAEWRRDALALGPIYRCPAAGEPAAGEDRERQLIDGRWIRVRERPMPDGGLLVLTSDVTDRIRTETALEENRRTHEAVLAAALDCFVRVDETGRIVAFNPAAERTFGYAQAEAIGRPLDELLVPERHREAHAKGFARHLATGETRILGRRIEVAARCKDGREIPVEVVVVAARHGGRPAYAAYMRDLSEQKRAEAALRASEARFLAAAESIPDGLMILDAEDRIVFHNSRHPELLPPALREVLRLGVRFEDWVREGLARGPVYHPDMGTDYADVRLASRRRDGASEREHEHADGRWVRIREAPMPDGGRVILTTDVTAQREAEAALRASEARFLAAAESIPDGLAIFDADDRFVYFNSRYPEHVTESLRPGLALGVRFEDWIREGLARGPVYHPDMGDDFLERRFAWHGQERSEHEQKLIDGRWLRLRESRMADGGRVLLTTDVTERHRREQELMLLAMAVEQVGDPVEITDAEGRFTYVNPAFTRVTGYTAEAVIGREPQEVLHSGHHPPAFFVAVKEQLDRGEGWHGTIVNRRKDGELVHQNTTISPLRDEAGHITHYVAVKRDVTEQERAEAALRASEARYRALVETQTEFVVRQTPEGRLTFVNEAYCRYLGLPRGALLGRLWDELAAIVPEDHIDLADHIARLSPDRPSEPIEIRVALPDGSEHIEHWVDTGVFDAQGRIVEIQAVGRDVTEQKRAERALRESEARYRAVVEGQSEFILRVRPDGTLSFVNDAYCRYRGLTREVLLGGFNDVYHYPPEQQAKIHAAWASLTPEFPSVTYELVKPGKDGGERWEEWTDTAIFAPSGRVIEYQAIGRDVTERKRAEQALRESEARFRLIAEGVPLPIAITALDEHRVLFVNAKAREVFGIEVGEGREAVERFWADPGQRDEIARRLVLEGAVEQAEVRVRRQDGTAFDALLSARPIRYAGSRAVLGVIIDITERRRMEEALRASEARLTALMDHAPLVVHLKDREGRYLLANPESAKIFGREPASMIGRTPSDVFPPDEAAMIDRHHREVLETGEVVVHEEHQPSLDAYQWSIVIRFPIRDASGAIVVVGGFALDITERKRAEAALVASEQRFRAIADLHPTPMLIARLDDRRILFANRAYHELFGSPGERLDPAFSCDGPELQDAIFAAVGRGEPVESREVTLCTAAGAACPSMLTARGIDYEGARCCVMSFLDLTALKRAEAALRASEQRFRSIAEAHPMPLVIVRRADGRFLFANTPFRQLFGLGDGPLDDLRPEELYADLDGRQRFLEVIRAQGGVDALEQNLRRRDGTVFPAAITSRVIDYEGERAFVSSVIDLSERKAAEAEIQRQREALHQSEKLTALGALLAGVAHELNNPLSVVVGYASMLQELAPDEGTRTRAERVHAAAERCARIVKTFLAMARSRPPQRGPVSLGDVVEAALELSAYGLRTAGVEVVRELAPDLPAVWGDSDQLHQVLTNLIVNAQQALLHRAPPRRLVVRARRQDDQIVVEAEDNGPGMDEAVRKRIFEPFFTTKPQGVGTGIGLSVCHGIVAAHGGRITVDSTPGEGTRFAVFLPLTAEALPAAGTPAGDPGKPGRGKVLVVDDEKEIAELAALHLRRDGLAVEIVGSGREALARLEHGGFDLVVSDLRMPDIDGVALIGAIQRDHPELAGRVLLITGDALGAGVNEVVRRAGIPVLEKPLDLASLRAEVRRLLERARARGGGER